MRAIFGHTLSRSLGAILGWGLSIALLGIYIMGLYQAVMDSREQYLSLVSAYPPELMAAFGNTETMFTPAGYLNFTVFSYFPLVIGFYAVVAGSGLVAADEEKGTLDLVLAHPISRRGLFLGRLAALAVATAAMLVLGWLGFMGGAPSADIELSALDMLWPFLSLYAVVIFFAGLALLLSMLLPSRAMASATAGLLLVLSFFITTLERLDESVEKIADFSPLTYYQGGMAADGMKWGWFFGLLGLGLLFAGLAWWRFERRDIRVGGEGSWQFSNLWRITLRRKI
ncbi:MAG: ABC transporter permease subunit [Anaerolineales bacterium]|nr:ABC transporter permease subunit [Anaerolineales bacterium]